MQENLIQTRIIPPGFAGGIVHRKRLLSILNENMDKSLILICSSAGFGKTTLVQDFFTAGELNYAWYYVTPDINSFYTFFHYIVYSLKRLYKNFGEKSLGIINAIKKDTDLLSRDYKNNINDISAIFLNEFCESFDENVTLVLDDLHNINLKENGEWLNYLLNLMFDNLPRNLHIIITSRDVPGFKINKLKSKRRIFQLGTQDLVFYKDEIIELLDTVYFLKYTGDDVEMLRSNVSGWITGIHLILQAYGKDFKQVRLDNLINYGDIFNYFANEIFNELPDKTKEFLLYTALLENFDGKLCNHLFNINNSEQIINDLFNRNIFIQRSSISEQGKYSFSYNYQELFKIFLLTKLHELKSESNINAELNKLFEYYLKKNNIVLSINYGLRAKNYNAVVPVITKNFNSLFEKRSFDTLWKWISSIPDEIVNSDPGLLYFRGKLYHIWIYDDDKSLECINAALSLTEKDKDVSLFINCWITKSNLVRKTGKFEGLRTELSNLLTLNISPVERAKVLYEIAQIPYEESPSKYNETIEILTEALNICSEQNFRPLETKILSNIGYIYFEWGDMHKSIHYLEQALNKATDVLNIFRATFHLIHPNACIGNYGKAKVFLNKVNETYKSYPSELFKDISLTGNAILHFECGDFEECIKYQREIINLKLKYNIKNYLANEYAVIGKSYYNLKDYDSALKNYEFALDLADGDDLGLLCQIKLSSFKAKLETDPENLLIKTLESLKRWNFLSYKAEKEFDLADYYLSAGMVELAAKYLNNCLKVSSEKSYVSFLENEVLNSRFVFDFAISRPELSEYKKFIQTLFENVRQRLEFDWLSEKCRKRLTRQIKELDDIRMTSFGRLEFKLRGKQIPESKWTRKKSKFILAYLLAEPNRVLTKDKIVDDFLQDIPPEKVDAVYHRTLSDMRTALKVEYDFQIKSVKKGGKSKASKDWSPSLLLYEGGTLHLNSDFYYWSDCTEFEKLYNSAMSSGVDTDKKIKYCTQAIELYKGDFLPGYYDSWCEEMRQNYSNMFINICSELIKTLKEKELFLEIIKYTEKILKTDKLNHEAYVEMIEAYSRLGKINIAKDKLSLMLKVYDEEFGEKPEKSVLDKINQILT